ncbi:MAG: SDR family oxidoreductase [Rhodospirillaceae bacterium]|jgi:3-oxoacyl-[acyl-carrier protein] reductase|nr:SDR family oxidoreductase [Rhodospirillaceae bacterium]MBT5940241.1 SDR family oxidoreductase [Rhodospirillaceae bacterium]MBT7267282.1 SDR family oxidoreductase [Rhodospirillaceae bacterium]
MDLGIKGKTALVLGASQGIGAGIARALAAEGCNVIVGARREDVLAELVAELKSKNGVEAEAYSIDMTDKAAVAAMCEKIQGEWQPEILLNNAGGPPGGNIIGVDDEIWEASLQALLMSVIRISEAALEAMIERQWGRILTVTSSGVIAPIPTIPVSNVVRSGIVSYSKTLANEVAKHGITVNTIIPGRIDTERTVNMDKFASEKQGISVEDVQKKSWAQIPAGRYGSVEEFADVAAFLLSARASYVTGSQIRIDGGTIKNV